MYVRYVDDCRLLLPAINKGWFWTGTEFQYSEVREQEDIASGLSDEQRTTTLIANAMSSIIYFLKFTGEDRTMFGDNTLPTLDTTLWLQGNQVKNLFYEKPTVGNQVVQRDTAIPWSSITSTLIQETVRRLKNSSIDTEQEAVTRILSQFSQKMINSGHSVNQTKRVLVSGVTKFLFLVDCSRKKETDPLYKPLYVGKEYKAEERQLSKYLAKMNWFRKKNEDILDDERKETDTAEARKKLKLPTWRDRLKGVWREPTSGQRSTRGRGFSSLLQIPNTKGAKLMKTMNSTG